jgi:signal transduction histidine kinase
MPELDTEAVHMLAHELRNTLFAIDLLLERALEHEKLGTDPMADVQRARDGVAETLEIVKTRLA